METQDTRGLTQRELILEMRDDIKSLVSEQAEDQIVTERELGRRPTRSELYSTIGALGIVVGIIVSLAL